MADERGRDKNSPPKGILKNPKQVKKQKSFQWDEMNILATYHPADKTYGHMKVDEPKTPYVFETDDASGTTYGAAFSAEELAARLNATKQATDADQLPRAVRESDYVDPVEAEHQRQFREKRKLHYNEFLAAQMAKGRLETENDSSDDDDLNHSAEEAARNARINAALSRMPPSSTNEYDNRRSRSRSPVHDSTPDRSSTHLK